MKPASRINWKLINLSAWLVVILSYVLPFEQDGHIGIHVGFPLSFMTIYEIDGQRNLLSAYRMDLLVFLLDAALLYGVSLVCLRLYKHFRK
ncbi:hypothetical protein [Paenibacillus wulumuqiensis]|uniref:hypothetical protein n=1 Tax=Paenibacillus wulumuqiensis TaxID=1567107 RepID=UPI0006190E00|nr:hypothetical protein [Paenibacillus wulumuqiensis]